MSQYEFDRSYDDGVARRDIERRNISSRPEIRRFVEMRLAEIKSRRWSKSNESDRARRIESYQNMLNYLQIAETE
jgi:hypothetical protein